MVMTKARAARKGLPPPEKVSTEPKKAPVTSKPMPAKVEPVAPKSVPAKVEPVAPKSVPAKVEAVSAMAGQTEQAAKLVGTPAGKPMATKLDKGVKKKRPGKQARERLKSGQPVRLGGRLPAAPQAAAPKATSASAWPENLEDQGVECKDCGSSFVFSADEQGFFRDKGFAPGSMRARCKDCTYKKKAKYGEAKQSGGVNGEAATLRCYNCGKNGHMSRDCPAPRSSSTACYICGDSGHKSRECPKALQAGGDVCFHCGGTGHFSAACTAPKVSAAACFHCGETSHISSLCPGNAKQPCHNWQKSGKCSRGDGCRFAHQS